MNPKGKSPKDLVHVGVRSVKISKIYLKFLENLRIESLQKIFETCRTAHRILKKFRNLLILEKFSENLKILQNI